MAQNTSSPSQFPASRPSVDDILARVANAAPLSAPGSTALQAVIACGSRLLLPRQRQQRLFKPNLLLKRVVQRQCDDEVNGIVAASARANAMLSKP